MGSNGDKVEHKVDKSLTAAAVTDAAFHRLRLQSYPKQKEVHCHDDKDVVVFVWPGVRSFRDHAWPRFMAMRHMVKHGQSVAFLGRATPPSGGRKAGVLVMTNVDGAFKARVDELGTQNYDFAIAKDDTVEFFHDRIQEMYEDQ